MIPSLSTTSSIGATPALGTQAARGACWTIGFSMLTKAVSFGSQIALGWLLLPTEFGLVAMTFAILGFVSLLTGSHLAAPLIAASNDQFRDRAAQVFWLLLGLNVVAACFLVMAAPFAASQYGEPRVQGLILLLAVSVPITALPVVYAAKLYRELSFQAIAAIHFGQAVIQSGGAIVLALLGFGASSLILPLTASAVFSLICSRLLAGPMQATRLRPRTWWALLLPVGWLMLHSFFLALQNSGPNFVLGLKQNPAESGIYFWGYSFSSQIGFMLAVSLQNVVFPSLAKLNEDPARQQLAVQKACRTLMMIIPPLGFLQMLLAEPLIKICFPERWYPAVPVVQWFSMTLLTVPLSVVAISVCLARQQYCRLALLTGVSALLTATGALLGTATGDASHVALCVSLALIASHLIYATAFRNGVESLRVPLAMALPCALAAWLFCKLLPELSPGIRILSVISIMAGGYMIIVQQFSPELLREIIARVQGVRRRAPDLAA